MAKPGDVVRYGPLKDFVPFQVGKSPTYLKYEGMIFVCELPMKSIGGQRVVLISRVKGSLNFTQELKVTPIPTCDWAGGRIIFRWSLADQAGTSEDIQFHDKPCKGKCLVHKEFSSMEDPAVHTPSFGLEMAK